MAKKVTDKKSLPKTTEELKATLDTKQADLIGYRRGLVAGELTNPSIIRQTRKEIARIKTAITLDKQSKEGEK